MSIMSNHQKVYVSKAGIRIFFSMKDNHGANYTLRALKRRLKQSSLILWNVFVHLTYNNEGLQTASGNDIRKLMNKIKQYNRNSLRKYQARERIDNKLKYVDKPRYKRWGKIYDYWKGRNDRFVYCWKIEFDSKGSRTWNPHFHMLLSSPFYISKQKIDEWWGHGFVRVKGIHDQKTAKKYVSKYMSKDTSAITQWQGRHFGHSRNLPPDVKNWTYEGIIPLENAFNISKMQREKTLYGYDLVKEMKHLRKVKPVFAEGYTVSPIRKDQKETLLARQKHLNTNPSN